MEDDASFHNDNAKFILWVGEAVMVVAEVSDIVTRGVTAFGTIGFIRPLIGAVGFDIVARNGLVSRADESTPDVFCEEGEEEAGHHDGSGSRFVFQLTQAFVCEH